MPHLKLEYSANVTQPVDFSALFAGAHAVLVEVAGIPINNCKSRAISREVFYVGDGDESHAVVHLEIAALEGRTAQVKGEVTARVLELLRGYYAESLESLELQISVEFRDIERASYAKIPEGTLSKPGVGESG